MRYRKTKRKYIIRRWLALFLLIGLCALTIFAVKSCNTNPPATEYPTETAPLTTDPQTTEPQTTDPQTTEPLTEEPTTEPLTQEPTTKEPATKEPEPTPGYTITECNDYVYVIKAVNKRLGPGTNYELLGTLPKFTKLNRIAYTSTGWSKIKEGYWVSSDYIDTKKPQGYFELPEEVIEVKKTGRERIKQIEEYLNSPELRLINADNPLGESYVPNVVELPIKFSSTGSRRRFDERYADKAIALMDAVRSLYPKTYIASAYRDYATQKSGFESQVKIYTDKGYLLEEAKKKAATIVAVPGTSEHQYGLTLDISDGGGLENNRIKKLGYAIWLKENSYRYGFILRYPENKTDITKIIFEPWHFRYVGPMHAKIMKDNDWCLEEYVEALKKELSNLKKIYE